MGAAPPGRTNNQLGMEKNAIDALLCHVLLVHFFGYHLVQSLNKALSQERGENEVLTPILACRFPT